MLFGSKESKIEKAVAKKNAAAAIKLLGDKDTAIVLKAIEALGKIPGDESYNELIALLRSPNSQVRAAAVTALGVFGDPKGRAHVAHMEKTEKDVAVLKAIGNTLAKLHGKD